jgi:hypothetical protein
MKEAGNVRKRALMLPVRPEVADDVVVALLGVGSSRD